MSHKNCCKSYKRPKTVAQFAALCYPSNPGGHSDIKNRIRNPEWRNIKVDPAWKAKKWKLRGGWWFRLDPNKVTHLLDGSGDGLSRGEVIRSQGVDPKDPKDPNQRYVCFNACALKKLIPAGGTTPVLCGFTWNVSLRGKVPDKKNPPSPSSGWIPLDSIKLDDPAKNRPKVLAMLKGWNCCVRRYRDWGKSFTRPNPILYKFRSVEALKDEVKDIAQQKVKLGTYFKEQKKGSIRKVIRKAAAGGDRLQMGIHEVCFTGNRLTDYLPKGYDFKGGWYENGYTNLCTNVSFGQKEPRMAPIALDSFPANHDFHRLKFKGGKRVYGFVYSVPKSSKKRGKLIGRVEWYFGYCDVNFGDKDQRRYGWVPSLAVRLV